MVKCSVGFPLLLNSQVVAYELFRSFQTLAVYLTKFLSMNEIYISNILQAVLLYPCLFA